MRACLVASLGLNSVYCESEAGERLLPCVVLKATFKEEDFSLSLFGRYAKTLEFRATAMVPVSTPDSARELEHFASRLREAIESAVIPGGWNYLRLDLAGDDRAIDSTKREYSHIYTVTAHEI